MPDRLAAKASYYLAELSGRHSQELLGLKERRENILTIAPIGFVVGLVFALFNLLLTPYWLIGAIEAACAILLLLPALRMVSTDSQVRTAENMLMLSGVLIFTSLVVMGGVGGTGLFWAFTFPFLAFFIKGQQKGWRWNIGFLALVCVLLVTMRGQPFAYPYDAVQIPHYLSSLLFITVVAACFNLLRCRFQEKLHIAVVENTAAAQQYLEQLQFLALHDPVTELPNRTRSIALLDSEILAAGQQSSGLLIIAMRLGRLPEISNIIGSQATDRLMQQISHRLGRIVGEHGLLGRLSREEFLILFRIRDRQPDIEQLRRDIGQHQLDFEVDGFPVHIEYSAGISIFPVHGNDSDTLLRKAEQAMLLGVQQGNAATVFDSCQERTFVHYHYLHGRLRDALSHQQLSQHYQPLINIRTRKLIGVEALARWFDPDEGFISPIEFIPIAESSGLIKPLTRWTIREAMCQCARWQDELPGIAVSINLSVKSLFDEALLPMLKQSLTDSGIDPQLVKLEITESQMMTQPERSLGIMRQLIDMGFKLSMDDYGTGFSSLAYLKQLPVQELKIDQSFIRHLIDDRGNLAIVDSTIDLAHQLGLTVVAEGIEDQETLQQLWLLGCDTAQGYYFGKPMAVDDFRAWARHYQASLEDGFIDPAHLPELPPPL